MSGEMIDKEQWDELSSIQWTGKNFKEFKKFTNATACFSSGGPMIVHTENDKFAVFLNDTIVKDSEGNLTVERTGEG